MNRVIGRYALFGAVCLSLVLATGTSSKILLSAEPAQSSSQGLGSQFPSTPPNGLPPLETSPAPVITRRQRQGLIKMHFKKMKTDAATLATLAQSLQKEIDKSNADVLSVDVIQKAEKIEKLAKNIRNNARGY